MWTRVLVFAFVLAAAFAAEDAKVKPRPKEFTGPDARAQALRALVEQPAQPYYIGRVDNERMYLPDDYYRGCPEAIDFLARTPLPVDADLLKLARSDHKLIVRYRAVRILAERGNPVVEPILLDLGTSKASNERLLGWQVFRWALADGRLKTPRDLSRALRQYEKEDDEEVREEIERFLGHTRAREAVPLLMATLKKGPSNTAAAWALGAIGDPAAVPLVIECFEKRLNSHVYLAALGKLATPEAVDFLIAHLDAYGAVEALAETRSPRALPALRRHVARLRVLQEREYFTARIHCLCLKEKDPRGALLVVAADAAQDYTSRFEALREYDTHLFTDHFLQVYRTDSDEDIKRACIWLLDSRPGTDITAAMMDHALHHKIRSMADIATEHYLREALNRRLGTYYHEMDDLRAYIRKHRLQ